MALWMEAGSEPTSEKEIADLEAISALKESTAIELKEKGNEYVKKGKKHYPDAINCYTRAINQKALNGHETSVLYANRAHVNLLLGNRRRALDDSLEALKICQGNVKAHYRAAMASLALNLLVEAKSLCETGIQKDPTNEDLKKLRTQIASKRMEQEERDAQVSKAVAEAKELLSAFEVRRLKIGKAVYQELTDLRKPALDHNKILHWPGLLLYAEVMSSDFIEDFCETDMLSAHLDVISFLLEMHMFSEDCPPLPWDKENSYTREALEVYYEGNSGHCLSKNQILRNLLEGTAGSNAEIIGEEEKDTTCDSSSGSSAGPSKWIKVNEKRLLQDVLKAPDFIIPGIPVFYVVSRKSSFYKEFRSGKWSPPALP